MVAGREVESSSRYQNLSKQSSALRLVIDYATSTNCLSLSLLVNGVRTKDPLGYHLRIGNSVASKQHFVRRLLSRRPLRRSCPE